MSMRDKINNSPAGAVGLALVVLACAAGAAWLLMGGNDKDPANMGEYFFDLTTGELVFQQPNTLSPTTLPNGNDGVQAVLYACGECPDELTMDNVVYVRRLDPKNADKVKAAVDSGQMDLRRIEDPSLWQIATTDQAKNDQWVSEASPQSADILKLLATYCDGKDGRKILCHPYGQ